MEEITVCMYHTCWYSMDKIVWNQWKYDSIDSNQYGILEFIFTWPLRKQAAYKQATRGPMALSPFRGTRQWRKSALPKGTTDENMIRRLTNTKSDNILQWKCPVKMCVISNIYGVLDFIDTHCFMRHHTAIIGNWTIHKYTWNPSFINCWKISTYPIMH